MTTIGDDPMLTMSLCDKICPMMLFSRDFLIVRKSIMA